jgi:hypothetical protein
MTTALHKGAKVHWNWGPSTAEGWIVERFERRVTRTIKGKRITRTGSADKPAYLIEQAGGGRVLKSASELSET